MEDADRAGAVQVHCAEVVHVLTGLTRKIAPVPGDAAGVLDHHRAAGSVVYAAATGIVEVADHAAVADRPRPAVVVDAAAAAVGDVAGQGAVADRHRPAGVVDAAAL